ncbi:MAG: hypothetical protein ABFS86_09500 [Planctomycetota bacterium]
MKIGMTIGIIVLATAVLAACGTSHGTHGMDLSRETTALIRKGMSQSEVHGILGDPYRVTRLGETREQWTYRYFATKVDGKIVHRPVEPPTDPRKPAHYHGAIFIMFDSEGRVGVVGRR